MNDQPKTPVTTSEPTASQAIEAYRKEHPIRFLVSGFIGNIVAVFRKRP